MFLVLYRARPATDQQHSRNTSGCCGSANCHLRPTRASRPAAPGPSLALQILLGRPAGPTAARAARGRGSGRSRPDLSARRSSPARGARRPSTTRSSAAPARRARRAAFLLHESRPSGLLRGAGLRASWFRGYRDRNQRSGRRDSMQLDSRVSSEAPEGYKCHLFVCGRGLWLANEACAAGFTAKPVEVLMPRPRVPAMGQDTIRRGKAPRSCMGQPF